MSSYPPRDNLPRFPGYGKRAALVRTKSAKRLGLLEERFLEAADQSNIDEVHRCIVLEVNPNCSNKNDGYTALHLAAERGDLPLALILVTCKNLAVEPVTLHGYSPLHLACLFNRIKMVRFLLKNGANPNTHDRFEETPLHIAVFSQSIAMAQILFKHGAQVDVIDAMERTPLNRALIDSCFLPMAKLLLQHGANPNIYTGAMPLFLECVLGCHTKQQIEVIEFLISHGVNAAAVDTIGRRNALHYVALSGFYPLVPILLRAGVDPEKKDYIRKKPIDIANDHNNRSVALLLMYYQRNPQASITNLDGLLSEIL